MLQPYLIDQFASLSSPRPRGRQRTVPSYSSDLFRLPRNGFALDFLEQHRGDQPEDADGHDSHEHDVDLQQLPRVPDQVADAALGSDELGRDQHDERDRKRDAQSCEDRRQRSEEHDAGEHHGLARAVILRHVPVDRLDVGGADIGVDDDGEEDGNSDEGDLRGVAKAEGEQQERHQRDLRDRKQRGDERIDEDAHRPEHGHEQPNRDGGDGADDVAEDNAVERDGDVPFEFAAAGELDETLRDVARRGDEPAIADPEHQQDLPDDDERERRDQIKQALARLGGHLDLHG